MLHSNLQEDPIALRTSCFLRDFLPVVIKPDDKLDTPSDVSHSVTDALSSSVQYGCEVPELTVEYANANPSHEQPFECGFQTSFVIVGGKQRK